MPSIATLSLPLFLGIIGRSNAAPAVTTAIPSTSTISTRATVAHADNTWWPPVNSTWQIVLNAPIQVPRDAASLTPNADVWDIDMFGNSASTIKGLRNMGKGVICYFSAGSYEPYRPDSSQFEASDLGNVMDGWPDETWIDIRSANVRNIMAARIQLAKAKGCDAIDPDNVDGYNNDNGLGLTQQDSIDYLEFLSSTATQADISIGLKNALEILPSVASVVQFAVNEQCVGYAECDNYIDLVESGKAVFHIEYPNRPIGKVKGKNLNNICTAAGLPSVPDPKVTLSTVLKNTDLGGLVQLCNGDVVNTPTR